MNKEESLAFLQECIKKIDSATAQDIEFYKEMYLLHCDSRINKSDFENENKVLTH